MSKLIKYSSGIAALIFIVWHSVDVRKLDEYKTTLQPTVFNATDFAETFWNDSLPASIADAPKIIELYALLNQNPQSAYKKYGRKLGISKTNYFMLKGNGTINKVENEFLLLSIEKDLKVKIATDFIYGNALRDGSGKININDFLNMTDFNLVSVEINRLIKEKVVAPLRKSVKTGQKIEFAGAIEVNSENMDLENELIIPVSFKTEDEIQH